MAVPGNVMGDTGSAEDVLRRAQLLLGSS